MLTCCCGWITFSPYLFPCSPFSFLLQSPPPAALLYLPPCFCYLDRFCFLLSFSSIPELYLPSCLVALVTFSFVCFIYALDFLDSQLPPFLSLASTYIRVLSPHFPFPLPDKFPMPNFPSRPLATVLLSSPRTEILDPHPELCVFPSITLVLLLPSLYVHLSFSLAYVFSQPLLTLLLSCARHVINFESIVSWNHKENQN